ncbi:MAG: HigA family addiction module antitoxin [Leptospirales bacterium]
MNKKLKPFLNIGPGQIIKREMEALNWSQIDLSEIISMAPKSISQMINNKQSITVETAFLLSKAFDSSPEFWMNLEQNYRLRLKEDGQRESETSTKAEIRRHVPLLEMKKKGWVSFDSTAKSQVQAYCNFWQQKKPDFSSYDKQAPAFHARKSKADPEYTKNYSITWLQKAHIEVSLLADKAAAYNATRLEKLAVEIPTYSLKPDGVKTFIQDLYKTGVHFFILSHLPKTYLDGAAFQVKNKKCIVYTARHNRVDNFWFTIAHEIAHILKHVKTEKDCFLDNLDEESADRREKEADALAEKWMLTKEILKLAKPHAKYLSHTKLLEISATLNIEPSIIVGALQHHGIIEARKLNKYKQEVKKLIPKKYHRG